MIERIESFILNVTGKKIKNFNKETSLENDLGIYGDDADEFIIAFGKEFNVDIVDFDFAKYFSGEGGINLPAIMRFLTGKSIFKSGNDLKIKHLIAAIKYRKLNEEIISIANNENSI